MSFDEIDLKNRIQEQTRDLQVPDSLKPEVVEQRLSDANREMKKNRRKSWNKRRGAMSRYMVLAAAACFVLVIGIVGNRMLGQNGMKGDNEKSEVADASMPETAGEDGQASKGKADAGAAGAGEEKKVAVNTIRTAKDYDEVYKYIEAAQKETKADYSISSGFVGGMFSDVGGSGGNGGLKMELAMDDAASSDGASVNNAPQEIAQTVNTEDVKAESQEVEHSDTNTREEDVAEADIVKTDGKHLYILFGRRVEIVDITGEAMVDLGEIVLSDEVNVEEIYLQMGKLIVTYTESRTEGDEENSVYRTYTTAETFDVSNPAKPKSVGKISQSGRYYTTRIKDGYVYLFSNYYSDYGVARTYEEGYVPVVDGQKLAAENLYLPMLDEARKYLVVSSFSLEKPDEVVDNKAIFGDTDLCYVSSKNIYVCENSYEYEEISRGSKRGVSQTNIRKIAYKDGEMSAVGQTTLDGTVRDSFCLDEYKGNLRLVTTVTPIVSHDDGIMPLLNDIFSRGTRTDSAEAVVESEEKVTNSLYVLDENLNVSACIDGLAEDERVYSARFMGDTGYFVTFREMDPLFSVDLSNPKAPKILGALKIPGFSDYMHPYGDGKLLGIGMDVDEEGVTTNGVKLSMFDISNPADVTEAHKYVLEGTYSTDVSYNYKAAFVDAKKNLIGFMAYGDGAHYYIFSYGKEGFECLFDRELIGVSSDVRALYAGDKLYLVAGNTVVSYRLETLEKVDDIVLGASALPNQEGFVTDDVAEEEISGWLELEEE